MSRLTVTYTDGARLTIVQDLVPEFSPEAQAMLDVYSTLGVALVDNELNQMVAYVDKLVASGNYLLFDYETIYPLGKTNEINGLIDWKGSKVATNNGATFDVFGATFAGAQDINTNWVPSVDGVNYQLSNSIYGIFTKLFSGAAGGVGAIDTNRSFQQVVAGDLRGYVNTTGYTTLIGVYQNESLYIMERTAANNQRYVVDGINQTINATAPTGIPATPMYVGQIGNSSNYYTGTISTFMSGAAIGFNQAQYNTDLRALLTGLGTI